jgi:hypothetical protein
MLHLLRHHWLILVVVLIGGGWLPIAYVSGGADGETPRETRGPGSVDVGSWTQLQVVYAAAPEFSTQSPGVHVPIQATETLSHTIFLPLVSHNARPPISHSYGLQIYGAQPEVMTKLTEVQAHWIRLPIFWSSIEPANTIPPYYRWSTSFEADLERLAAQHFQIVLNVMGNPSWAATYPGGPVDKVDPGEFAEFLNAAVARYSGPPYNVKYWELYNEPDNGDIDYADAGWGYFGNDPAAYAQMLATVYGPIKAADPQAQVVFGGILYDYWAEDGGPFVKGFLDGVLQYIQDHAGSYFDVMNFHYYPGFDSRWEPYGPGLIGKTTFLRDKLAFYGLYKPFICTEIGAQSSAFGNDCCSDELQARYVVQTFARGTAADLESVIWFKLIDDPGLGYWKTGLLNDNLNPRLAFYTYQIVVDQLGSADYVRVMESGEFKSDLIEGYIFFEPKTATQILVAWSQGGEEANNYEHEMTIPTGQLTLVDKSGNQTVRYDGDDGLVDGSVQVVIGLSPVYLRFIGDPQALGYKALYPKALSHNATQDGLPIAGGLDRSWPQ